jgi:hypothetical protein
MEKNWHRRSNSKRRRELAKEVFTNRREPVTRALSKKFDEKESKE